MRADLSMAVFPIYWTGKCWPETARPERNSAGFLATAANGGLTDRSDTPARVTFALAAG